MRFSKILSTILFCVVLLLASSAIADMNEYCSKPPFITQAVSPNILILMDNSGSMNERAYKEDFNSTKDYYGYFVPEGRYTYDSNVFQRDSDGKWDGSFLNWLTMRRIDVARKALMGGLATSRTGGGNQHNIGEDPAQDWRSYEVSYTDTEGNAPDHANSGDEYWYRIEDGYIYVDEDHNYSYDDEVYKIEVEHDVNDSGEEDNFVDGNLAGVLQKIGNKARWGVEFFNYGTSSSNENGGEIAIPMNGTTLNQMANEIQNKKCDTWTPLAEAYHVATKYFKQEDITLDGYPNNIVPNNNKGQDPYYFKNRDEFVWCAKSFVLVITDGASTKDEVIPEDIMDHDNDGNDLDPDDNPDHTGYDDGGTDFLDDYALYSRTTDLSSNSTGNHDQVLKGHQNLIFYSVYAFSDNATARNLLQDAAKNGGFKDKNGNDIPDLQSEWDKDGDGIPDTYFEAQDGTKLESQITRAVNDILSRASSGTAVSAISTSTRGSGSMAQAYFQPRYTGDDNRELSWMGRLTGLWIDEDGRMREDSDTSNGVTGNATAQLELDKDEVLVFAQGSSGKETKAHLYNSTRHGDVVTPCSYDQSKSLVELNSIWNMGKQLWKTQFSERDIFTGLDLSNDTEVDLDDDFSSTYSDELAELLQAYDSTDAENIINYVRGSDVDVCLDSPGSCSTTGHRNRLITLGGNTNVWKLGDIVYSTPRMLTHRPVNTYHINYDDDSYDKYIQQNVYNSTSDQPLRQSYLFVGANDGMLHCFYPGKVREYTGSEAEAILNDSHSEYKPGQEVWSFIPKNALPYLKYLAYPGYGDCHLYYVDKRPLLVDASIGSASGNDKDADDWRTLLIGQMRFGGCADNLPLSSSTVGRSSIFALDVTDPESPEMLWEFTHSDLGFTTSSPAIVRTGPEDQTGKWSVVIGSGPKGYSGDSFPGTGYLFAIDLRNGDLQAKIEVGDSLYMGDLQAVDADQDYDSEVIYGGTVEGKNREYGGSMRRILTPGAEQTGSAHDKNASWQVSTLKSAGASVTAPPEIATDKAGNLWVYWGTGKFFGSSDQTNGAQQHLYGVKDTAWQPDDRKFKSSPGEVTDIFDASDVVVEANATSYICKCEGGELGTCSEGDDLWDNATEHIADELANIEVKNVTIDGTTYNDWDAAKGEIVDEFDGWKKDLNASSPTERSISAPAVVAGKAIFNTFEPVEDICGSGGESYIHSLDYMSGLPTKQIVIQSEAAYDESTGEVTGRAHIGSGIPAPGNSIVTKQVGSTTKAYIQLSTGEVEELNLETGAVPYRSLFWIEK